MSLAISAGRASSLSGSGTENNPIFGWNNMATWAGVTITSNVGVLSDGALLNAVSGTTFDCWRPVSSASITSPTFLVDMGVGVTVAPVFFGFVGHNIGIVASVTIHSSPDAITWTLVETIAVAGFNGVCDGYYTTVPTARRYWRFTFNSLPALGMMRVAGIFMGDVITSPQRLYQGFAPALTPTEVELQSNVSAGGNLLGSAVVKRGSRIAIALQHMPSATIRGAAWKAMQATFNDGGPMFAAWRPTSFPEDLHYIWRDGAVMRPDNSGPKDLMSVSIEARAYEG